jgi:hypothetical protein
MIANTSVNSSSGNSSESRASAYLGLQVEMTDSLCGPSNALQSFKSHTQVDRTLQQDRLTGPRHSPAQVCDNFLSKQHFTSISNVIQGFRTPDLRAGSLDGEFAAFEAGPQQTFHLQQQQTPTLPQFEPFQQSPQFSLHSSTPGWAADFHKLRLGSAPNQPIPQAQFRTEAPLVRSNNAGIAGWHDEFMRKQQQSAGNGKQAFRSPSQGYSYSTPSTMSQYPMAYQPPEVYQEPQYAQNQEPFHDAKTHMPDDAAFEAAFAQAEHLHTSSSDHLPKEGQVAGVRLDPILQPHLYDHQPLRETMLDRDPEQLRIGSDTIPYTPRAAPRTIDQTAKEADDLARTAGELLSSVQHDTSEKFGQSQFLALMRRIRDREVEVRDEDLKETGTGVIGSTREQDVYQGPLGAGGSNGTADYQSSMVERAAGDQPQGQQPIVARQERVNSDAMRQREEEDLLRELQAETDEMRAREEEQMHALHPGGRGYPYSQGGAWRSAGAEQEEKWKWDHWASGGIGSEEDDKIEEAPGLAGRFRKLEVEDRA